jgi:hypothetical protein
MRHWSQKPLSTGRGPRQSVGTNFRRLLGGRAPVSFVLSENPTPTAPSERQMTWHLWARP